MTVWRRLRGHFDWPLTLCTLAIALIGIVNLFSATRAARPGMFEGQVRILCIGLVLFVVATAIDYRVWIRWAWLILGLALVAVVAVHITGYTVKGSRRWIALGSFSLQPSEFVKIAVILTLARVVHDRGSEKSSWLTLGARVAAFVVTIVLIAWQPDLGTAVLVALMCVSVLVLAARKLWPVATVLVAMAAAIPLVWAYALQAYQKKRILTFMDPSADPSGAGWHVRQSIFAIGSGRVGGKGYLHGTQNQLNFLPEHWSDFPFAVWAEEWGLAGAVVLLGLYLFLILWLINVASQARDRFGATVCVGVAAMIFWQVVVNIAMVTGLAPVVGVTLPLVSHGGSSVLTVLIGLGLASSVSIRRYVQ